jgi:hypothetical protein
MPTTQQTPSLTYTVKVCDFASRATRLQERLASTGVLCTVVHQPNNLGLGEWVIKTRVDDAMGAYYRLLDIENELNTEEITTK